MQDQARSWALTGRTGNGVGKTDADAPHAWLSQASTVFSLIAAYLALHFVLRLSLSPSLGIDDAEQVLFAQQWAPGYRFRQPPLFTWLLVPVIDVVGPSVLAVSIVRYTLLAITYGLLYLTARHWIVDRRLAALAAFSFTSIYVFAYYAHHDLTHTTMLAAIIAATLYTFTQLTRRPTILHYLLLGLCFGLGMLAKWNFVMLAVGLPLTCLLFDAYRPLVLTWKSLLIVAVMAAIVSPTALWMFNLGQSAIGVSDEILGGTSDLSRWALTTNGGQALITSITLFPLPFLVIFLLAFGKAVIPAGLDKQPRDGVAPNPNFLGWLMIVILGLHALLIPLFGAVTFTERWMHTALMILPLFLFAILAKRPPSSRSLSFYLAMIAILVAVVVGARLYRYIEGADTCGKCREFAPFSILADDLRGVGFTSGMIIADGMHMGGNLKMAFPESLVIDATFPAALWPNSSNLGQTSGMCLLVWRDDQPNAKMRRDKIKRYAETEYGVPATTRGKTGRLKAPLYRSTSRHYTLGFELIQENAGGCR